MWWQSKHYSKLVMQLIIAVVSCMTHPAIFSLSILLIKNRNCCIWSDSANKTARCRLTTYVCHVLQLPECKQLPQGVGHRISCLIEHKDNVTGAGCKQFLTKMASIVFSDYRLIYRFVDQCQKDINTLHCGRTNTEDDAVSVWRMADLHAHLAYCYRYMFFLN